LEEIHNGREHELRVERGWLKALKVLESTRERTQLQILECSRILAEQEARDAAEGAMQHGMNVEFNNQAKFIYTWLWRSIKRSQFCKNYKTLGPTFVRRK
jgi:hypothetical protein